MRYVELTLLAMLVVGSAVLAFMAVGTLFALLKAPAESPRSIAGFIWHCSAIVSFWVIGVGAIGLMLWLTADFLMTVPAAANGEDSSSIASARLSRGHRWTIVGIGILTSPTSSSHYSWQPLLLL